MRCLIRQGLWPPRSRRRCCCVARLGRTGSTARRRAPCLAAAQGQCDPLGVCEHAQLRDADVLRLLESQDRTYFAPGTGYRYSNSGYALPALIVERASGRSFAAFLRERIFAPLGMRGTVAYEQSSRSRGCSCGGGAAAAYVPETPPAIPGDGLLASIDPPRAPLAAAPERER